MHNYAQSVYSSVRVYDITTDMSIVLQSKVQPQMGLTAVTWIVDQEFQNLSVILRLKKMTSQVAKTGEGEGEGGVISWWGCVGETEASSQWVARGTSQTLTIWDSAGYFKAQVDQLGEWLKANPIPYISNDIFSPEGIFHYSHGQLSGHCHVNRTYPDVVRCGDSSMVPLHLEAG